MDLKISSFIRRAGLCGTSLAELLGGAIALQMLFKVPVKIGAILITVFVMIMLLTNSYRKIEKWIIGSYPLLVYPFIRALSCRCRLGRGWNIMDKTIHPGRLNASANERTRAVVMPHNLFLHSEVIQSRHGTLKMKV